MGSAFNLRHQAHRRLNVSSHLLFGIDLCETDLGERTLLWPPAINEKRGRWTKAHTLAKSAAGAIAKT